MKSYQDNHGMSVSHTKLMYDMQQDVRNKAVTIENSSTGHRGVKPPCAAIKHSCAGNVRRNARRCRISTKNAECNAVHQASTCQTAKAAGHDQNAPAGCVTNLLVASKPANHSTTGITCFNSCGELVTRCSPKIGKRQICRLFLISTRKATVCRSIFVPRLAPQVTAPIHENKKRAFSMM